MKIEELAALINGREYLSEITKEESQIAKESGLLVIFGNSDDLLEFRGVIDDELGAWNGRIARITHGGERVYECEYCNEREIQACKFYQYFLKHEKTFTVSANWCPAELECSWLITATVPGVSFDIMEDGELFCRGLIIDMKDLNGEVTQ